MNYFQAEVDYWKSRSEIFPLEDWKKEVSIWRLSQVKEKSPECLSKGLCVNCGCDVISSSFGSNGCEYGCYPERPSEKEWNKFKKTNKLQIS